MPADCPSAVRSPSVPDPTTSERRTDSGLSSVSSEQLFPLFVDIRSDDDLPLFSCLAWLQILAAAQEKLPGAGINEVSQAFYKKYGRSFFSR
jgi:phosphoglucomutase